MLILKIARTTYVKKPKSTEMNVLVIVISILLSVICVLLALLQHYYFITNIYKKPVVRYYSPEFEDLIPTDDRKFELAYPINIETHHEDSVLNDLTTALNSDSKDDNMKVTDRSKRKMGTDSEVYNTIQAALAFKMVGKNNKAMKLFEHASAMAPDNADVLNWYGEFLEQHHDIVTADELYFKVYKGLDTNH